MVWFGHLVLIKETFNAAAYKDIHVFMVLFQRDKASSIKT